MGTPHLKREENGTSALKVAAGTKDKLIQTIGRYSRDHIHTYHDPRFSRLQSSFSIPALRLHKTYEDGDTIKDQSTVSGAKTYSHPLG